MFTSVILSQPLPLPSGAVPQEIIATDLNGDGLNDLFVPTLSFASDGNAYPLLFLTGNASGGFTDSSASLFGGVAPTALYAARVVTGDFNGDGRPDFFVIDSGPDKAPFPGGQNGLLLSTPGGYVDATANLPQLTIFSHGAAVGDVNNDGNKDVVIFALDNNTTLQLLFGDGHGHFISTPSALPAVYQVAGALPGSTWGGLFDLNADGFDDIVVGTWSNAKGAPSQVFLNDGHGSFAHSTAIALPMTGLVGESVVQALSTDINGDGKPDLILSVTDGGPSGGPDFYTVPYIQILIGDGAGHFKDETQSRLPQATVHSGNGQLSWDKFLTLVDVDGDGFKDIVASNESQSKTTVYVNDGSGHYSAVSSVLPNDAAPLYRAGQTVPYAFAAVAQGSVEIVANDLPVARASTAIANVMHAPQPALVSAISSGTQTLAQLIRSLPDVAVSTTSVATLSYQFFTGSTPSAAGLDYLLSSSGPNPNNLNSAYYGNFSTLNRYINFASNLGNVGEGAAAFQTAYGTLSLADATSKAYAAVFGVTPTADKVAHLLHDAVPNGVGGTYEREDYFAAYGLDGLTGQGTKAAMVGWLLGTAAASDIGILQSANLAYLSDLANGKVSGTVNLVGDYHGTPLGAG